MAEEVIIRVEVIDQASKQMEQIGNSVAKSAATAQKSMLEFSSQATIASIGVGAALLKVGESAVMAGADLQQAQMAFTSLTGSGQEATKMMQFLTDLALKAPLDMEQTVEGSRRLLAYGMSAEKVREVFPGLVDAVSALGVEGGRLNKVTLAMGQIFNSATLKGQELRQLTEAGVPVYDMLAKAIQEGKIHVDGLSKGMTTLGGATKKQTAANEKASASMGVMNAQIKVMDQNLNKAKASGKKTGEQIALMEAQLNAKKAAAGGAAAAMGEYSKANENAGKKVMFAGASLEKIKGELVQVADLEIDGKQAAEALFEAFGQKYAGAAENQMKTFTAQLSNTRDVFQITSARIVGWTEEGVRAGSILEKLTTGLTNFNNSMSGMTPKIVEFTDAFMKNKVAMAGLAAVIAGLLVPAMVALLTPILALVTAAAPFIAVFAIMGMGIALLAETWETNKAAFYGIATALTIIGAAILNVVVPALYAMIAPVVTAAAAFVVAWAPIILIALAIGAVVAFLYAVFHDNMWGIRDVVMNAVNSVIVFFTQTLPTALTNFITFLGTWVMQVITWYNNLPIMIATAIYTFFTETLPYWFGFIIGWASIKFPEFIASMQAWFMDMGLRIITEVSTWPTRFMTWITDMITKVNAAVTAFKTWVITKLIELGVGIIMEVMTWPNRIMEWFKKIPENAKKTLDETNTSFKQGLDNIWQTVSGWVGKVVDAFNKVREAISAALSKASEAVQKGIGAGQDVAKHAHGGMVAGPMDAPVPIIAHGGERVIPRTGVDVNDGNGASGGLTINFNGGVSMDSEDRVKQLANMINEALGRQNELARYGAGY